MKKSLIYIITFIIIVFTGVISAWIYKFNFTNDDIYVQTKNWVVPYDSLKTLYTSFYPIYFLADSLVWDQANLVNIVPSGWEPHDFEPSLKQVWEMQKADLIVLNWLGMESYEEKLISSVWTGKVIMLSEELQNLIKLEEENHEEESHEEESHWHDHGDTDPHTWLSPKSYLQMAEVLSKELEKKWFKPNTHVLESLKTLDAHYETTLKNCTQKQIVTSHDAFRYLARDYWFEEHPIFGISPEEEPSAKDIADTIDLIKKQKLTAIFTEEFVSPKFANTIKKESGVQVLTLHPLETLTTQEELEKKDYISIMNENLEKLKIGLNCK